MKLPTTLGRQLLNDGFKARMADPSAAYQAVAAFQRMALVSSLEESIQAVKPWFKPEHQTVSKQSHDYKMMEAVYNCVKQDVLGLAIDSVMTIMDGSGASKDKLAAAAILNELYGEKELIKDSNLTDKLMINLVGNK